MDIQFYGANCITITVGGARIVIDDTLAAMGGKTVTKAGDISLFTHKSEASVAPADVKLLIDRAGEYEVSDISIYGIQARSHIDEDKQRSATMYKLIAKDIRILVTGHIYSKLRESDLESIGTIDVMIVPVGGNGYTVDPVGAVELIKEIEPKMVIPTFYADDKLTFPMPAQTLEQALTTMGIEPKERVSKLKLKQVELGENTQLVVLEKN
jgi:L-ascorbate metabolism protein UlaG (beta-lactamase superfamily)